MLLAHIDVVPANETDGWEVPPFSAEELNGFIYGRGTLDNKQAVMVWWAEWSAISFCLVKTILRMSAQTAPEYDYICP